MVDRDGDTRMRGWGNSSASEMSDDGDESERESVSSATDYELDRSDMGADDDEESEGNSESEGQEEEDTDDDDGVEGNEMSKPPGLSKVPKRPGTKLIKSIVPGRTVRNEKILGYRSWKGDRKDGTPEAVTFVVETGGTNPIDLVPGNSVGKEVRNAYFRRPKKHWRKIRTEGRLKRENIDEIIGYACYEKPFGKTLPDGAVCLKLRNGSLGLVGRDVLRNTLGSDLADRNVCNFYQDSHCFRRSERIRASSGGGTSINLFGGNGQREAGRFDGRTSTESPGAVATRATRARRTALLATCGVGMESLVGEGAGGRRALLRSPTTTVGGRGLRDVDAGGAKQKATRFHSMQVLKYSRSIGLGTAGFRVDFLFVFRLFCDFDRLRNCTKLDSSLSSPRSLLAVIS